MELLRDSSARILLVIVLETRMVQLFCLLTALFWAFQGLRPQCRVPHIGGWDIPKTLLISEGGSFSALRQLQTWCRNRYPKLPSRRPQTRRDSQDIFGPILLDNDETPTGETSLLDVRSLLWQTHLILKLSWDNIVWHLDELLLMLLLGQSWRIRYGVKKHFEKRPLGGTLS